MKNKSKKTNYCNNPRLVWKALGWFGNFSLFIKNIRDFTFISLRLEHVSERGGGVNFSLISSLVKIYTFKQCENM